MKRLIGLLCFTLAAADAPDGGAQVPPSLEIAAAHVVKLNVVGGGAGAGVIVGSDGGRVYIVTAKHNFTGSSGASCDRRVEVTFYWTKPARLPAGPIRCSATLDLAIVEANLPPNTPASRLPPQPLARESDLANSFNVRIIGHPEDSSWRVARHEISQTKGTFIAEEFEGLAREDTGLTTGPAPVPGGYSGGAVVDDDTGALVGIVLLAGERRSIFLLWKGVNEALKAWRPPVPTNLVTGEAPEPSVRFAPGAHPATATAEAVRSVLVRYVEALRAENIAAVQAVRPGVNTPEIAALFGDATRVELTLSSCEAVVVDGPEKAHVTCEYSMKVQRRTGDERVESATKATFHFQRKLLTWTISGVK